MLRDFRVAGRGSQGDLDAWVLETAPRATAYARSLLRNRDDADDIVQDCYCRLLAKAESYDLLRDGRKLLMASITNACINKKTRRKPMHRLVRTQDDGGETADDPADAKAIPPWVEVESNEFQTALAIALAELPTQQRAAVELKALGYSQQEIGEMIGVSTSNAGVLIYRGRQSLSKTLAPFLGGEVLP